MARRSTVPVNYDEIAPGYDSQPSRRKDVDPHLVAFLAQAFTGPLPSVAVLDIGCGTGNQLVADRDHLSAGLLVGLDPFGGMLRQARAKASDIWWVQGDGAHPPFRDRSFDFISSQFSFHHVQDQPAMLRAVFRLLKPGGRFVMVNICPQEMTDWIYYRYFPRALEIDLQDFLPREAIVDRLADAGFVNVRVELTPVVEELDLPQFLETVRRRETCSQLLTIPDMEYQAGLRRLEAEAVQNGSEGIRVASRSCLITLCGDRP